MGATAYTSTMRVSSICSGRQSITYIVPCCLYYRKKSQITNHDHFYNGVIITTYCETAITMTDRHTTGRMQFKKMVLIAAALQINRCIGFVTACWAMRGRAKNLINSQPNQAVIFFYLFQKSVQLKILLSIVSFRRPITSCSARIYTEYMPHYNTQL